MTADAGDWSGALGALLLFITNVLAIIVLGVGVFSAVRLRHHDAAEHRLRAAHAVVVIAGAIVTAALAVSTYRTVQLFDWQQSAKRIGSNWATAHGAQLLTARFDGDKLVLVIEGSSNASQDAQLLSQLHGQISDGTPVLVDRVVGGLSHIGAVGNS